MQSTNGKGMSRGLVADGLVMEANRELMGITNSLPRNKSTKGLNKAIIAVRDILIDRKQALHCGHIYSLTEKAQFIYAPLEPVDVYINTTHYDLIEVNDGHCWKISTRKFIDLPYDQSQLS